MERERNGGGERGRGLHLVQVRLQVGKTVLEPLSLPGLLHNDVGLGGGVGWVPGQHLPVVEHTLGECLAAGVTAQVSGET